MTTNHLEKLDPALIRPGRCDVKVYIANASREQMRSMFLRFFPGRFDEAQQFVHRLPAGELSMAQIQGHLLEHKHSAAAAVDRTLQLLQSSKPRLEAPMSVWGHLRRLGLEPYARLFECRGYVTKGELAGLTAAKVITWSVELRTNESARRRMEKLLEGTCPDVIADYQLADIATIKEAFLHRYLDTLHAAAAAAAPAGPADFAGAEACVTSGGGDRTGGGGGAAVPERPPELRRENSASGLLRSPCGGGGGAATAARYMDGPLWEEELVGLARELCERLTPGGKPAVSVFQLKRLINCLYPDDPRAAVAHAHLLTDKRPPAAASAAAATGLGEVPLRSSEARGGGGDGEKVVGNEAEKVVRAEGERWSGDTMTTYAWLRRLGMEQYAYGLEDGGYWLAHMLPLAGKEQLEKCNVTAADAQAMLDVLEMRDSRADLIAGFQCPDRRGAAALFAEAFPGEPAAARRFAETVTDAMGNGLVSTIEIHRYLCGWAAGDGAAATDRARAAAFGAGAALVDPPRAPRPPPAADKKPPPTSEFAYDWLTAAGLQDYAAAFVEHGLGSREELAAAGRLQVSELVALGVQKVGHQRKILRMMEALAPAPVSVEVK